MYAKLEDGILIPAPRSLVVKGERILNPPDNMLFEQGYLPVQYTEMPVVRAGFRAISRWEQIDFSIVQTWIVVRDNCPMSIEEVSTMLISKQINTLTVDDNTALRMTAFYPEWAVNTAYTVGYKVQRNGKLWRCLQAHTSQVTWEPENTPAMWEVINETHSGTLDDPIPYDGNMALENGKYYMQNYVIYLCTRDTVNPVYNPLSELVGVYVDAV